MAEPVRPENELQVVEAEDLDGLDCEETAEEFRSAPDEDDYSALDADEIEKLDQALRAGDDDAVADALVQLYGPQDFFRPGGGWGGSEAPARRAERIGHANRLKTTATKEQRPKNPGSDHDTDQKNAFAVDLSNGTRPTPEMDRTARQIAAAAGRPTYSHGIIEVTYSPHRMRMQLIWKWVGHYNHVHTGFRRR